MIQCQFMLLKMIIQMKTVHPPNPMMLKHYRNKMRSLATPGLVSLKNSHIICDICHHFKKGFLRFAKVSKATKIRHQKENGVYRSWMSLWNRFRNQKTFNGTLYGEAVL